MKKRILYITVATLLIGIFVGCEKKEENPYRSYNGISKEDKTLLHYDDFSTTSEIWPEIPLNNWFGAHTINDGYKLKSLYNDGRLISFEIEDLSSIDFEIEYTLQRIQTNSGKNAISFIWGASGLSNFYYLKTLDDYGSSTFVCGYYNGNSNDWYNDKPNALDQIPTKNKYTIRRVNEMYYLFINEVFIDEYKVTEFYGNYIGLILGGNSEAIFDDFKINDLIDL